MDLTKANQPRFQATDSDGKPMWQVYARILPAYLNGLYKTELIHRRAPWKTKESLELATLEWVSWFNHHRLLEPIGYIPPAEAEANYYRQLAEKTENTVSL